MTFHSCHSSNSITTLERPYLILSFFRSLVQSWFWSWSKSFRCLLGCKCYIFLSYPRFRKLNFICIHLHFKGLRFDDWLWRILLLRLSSLIFCWIFSLSQFASSLNHAFSFIIILLWPRLRSESFLSRLAECSCIILLFGLLDIFRCNLISLYCQFEILRFVFEGIIVLRFLIGSF